AQTIGSRPAPRYQIADHRIGTGQHVNADAAAIIDPGDVEHFARGCAPATKLGADRARMRLSADKLGGNQPDLPARYRLHQSLMQFGRQAVAVDIPPRAQMAQELTARRLRPALPQALI